MYSSMICLAMSAMLSTTTAAHLPAWQLDYRQARDVAAREQKPLAVVVGTGAAGWDKIVAGDLAPETASALRSGFVCVYVDKSTPDGEKLAKAFDLTKTTGLVISDRKGDLQAFRHEGQMADADLHRAAVRYADPALVVRSTESNAPPPAPVQYYQPAFGGCPSCRH